MEPVRPHWAQPSHPHVLEVIVGNDPKNFTTKSIATVDLPAYAVFAKFVFPPSDIADKKTYATVQISKGKHMNLNSDLLYINHSCEPTLLFDTSTFKVIVGPHGLKKGEELTFFYPSTEWDMAQPFDCFCGKATCRGRISGAKSMTAKQLEGVWLNGHICNLRDEQARNKDRADPTARALEDVVTSARIALESYMESSTSGRS